MSIKENIEGVIKILEDERIAINDLSKPHPLSDEFRGKATRAITGSAADWVIYMKQFAKDDQQLARLIPTDGTEKDVIKNTARAYLAANGMCAPGTGRNLGINVTGKLDR